MTKNTITKTVTVDEARLACNMGSGSLRVLATPAVVALMENAAAELAQGLIGDEALTTVGTAISVEHTSPTPLGAEISATAVLTGQNGRTFEFEVTAHDAGGQIARGTHTRVSVKAYKFQAKADGKFE